MLLNVFHFLVTKNTSEFLKLCSCVSLKAQGTYTVQTKKQTKQRKCQTLIPIVGPCKYFSEASLKLMDFERPSPSENFKLSP